MPAGRGSLGVRGETTVVYVMGAAHSGTTILYRMLALHPDVAWFCQFSCRRGEVPTRRRVPLPGAVVRALRWGLVHDWTKAQKGWRRYLVPTPGEATQIWDHLLPPRPPPGTAPAAGGRDGLAADRVRATIDAELAIWGRPVFLAKRPQLAAEISVLLAAHPAARFLHIVRDGRAVALSLAHRRPEQADPNKPSKKAVVNAARYWAEAVRTIAQQASSRLTEVRYEDFVTDIHGSLRAMQERVGLDPARFPFDRVPKRLQPTNDRWLASADRGQLHLIECVAGDELRSYGYLDGA